MEVKDHLLSHRALPKKQRFAQPFKVHLAHGLSLFTRGGERPPRLDRAEESFSLALPRH